MRESFQLSPVVLDGVAVRLEPLSAAHAPALFAASRAPEIWTRLPIPQPDSVAAVEAWIRSALATQAGGTEAAFAIVRKSDGRAVGSTRFLDLRAPHRAVEIGWTWLSPEVWRTGVNTEAKYLLLRHAFEVGGARRVQIKTDALNVRAREAISRLGAVFEGILRNYQTRAYDGYVRDTAMYSVTDAEWPAVKSRLETLMAAHPTA